MLQIIRNERWPETLFGTWGISVLGVADRSIREWLIPSGQPLLE